MNTSEILNPTQNETIFTQQPITNENWKLFVFLITLSTIFLIIAVAIYILLWEKHNLHGWTQFSYLVSSLLFNIVFIPALCPEIVLTLTLCFLISVANQYFFVASKMWLLIIGFDILWSLWKYELDSNKNNKHWKTFAIYNAIGWGVPSVIVSSGVILNILNRKQFLKKFSHYDGLWTLFPRYGHLHCRIPNWMIWELFVFSNCLIHVTIFIFIIFLILRHRYSTKIIGTSPCSRKSNSYLSFLVFLKLFIVVGLSWSYIALQDLLKAGNINTKQNWRWQIFRIIFFLQGAFISLVYVGNLKTIRALKNKYPRFKGIVNQIQEKLGNCRLKSRKDPLRKKSSCFTISISEISIKRSSSGF